MSMRSIFLTPKDQSVLTGQSSAEATPQDLATQTRLALQYALAEEMTAQVSAWGSLQASAVNSAQKDNLSTH